MNIHAAFAIVATVCTWISGALLLAWLVTP